MVARSVPDIERIWLQADGVRKLSDRVIGLGPFGIGLDGLISSLNASGVAMPFGIAADQIYTWGAGGYLIWLATRAHASVTTILTMFGWIAADAVVSVIPVLGGFADILFQGHLLAARALQRDIETAHYVEESWRAARDQGLFDQHRSAMAAAGKRRLVFLHD